MTRGAILLRRAIRRRGLSVRSAAKLLGIDHSYLSRITRGLASPSLALAGRCRLLFGVSEASWSTAAKEAA